jgi:hypothetical protein
VTVSSAIQEMTVFYDPPCGREAVLKFTDGTEIVVEPRGEDKRHGEALTGLRRGDMEDGYIEIPAAAVNAIPRIELNEELSWRASGNFVLRTLPCWCSK